MSEKNIFQRIATVMEEVTYILKDDHVKFGQQNYKGLSDEAVMTAVRPALVKNGIVIIPIEQEQRREGNITSLEIKYKIQNIDNQDDYIIAMSSGQGADTQDKGVGKAMTYARKYLLLNVFMIPTGEDPDKVPSAQLDYEEEERKTKRRTKADDLPVFEPKATIDELHRILNAADGDAEYVKQIISEFGYKNSAEILRKDVGNILDAVTNAGALPWDIT